MWGIAVGMIITTTTKATGTEPPPWAQGLRWLRHCRGGCRMGQVRHPQRWMPCIQSVVSMQRPAPQRRQRAVQGGNLHQPRCGQRQQAGNKDEARQPPAQAGALQPAAHARAGPCQRQHHRQRRQAERSHHQCAVAGVGLQPCHAQQAQAQPARHPAPQRAQGQAPPRAVGGQQAPMQRLQPLPDLLRRAGKHVQPPALVEQAQRDQHQRDAGGHAQAQCQCVAAQQPQHAAADAADEGTGHDVTADAAKVGL